ncbi:MAG: hypothetical protein FWC39_10260 [Bacteroidetes bacterium]|nr:hypothetical protein [Bacteroidota bacterium]
MKKEEITTIETLEVGDKFRTASGKKVYTIVDYAFPHNLDCKVWLLDSGHYVSNPVKRVVKL